MILAIWVEVLMLGDTGIGWLAGGIVDDRVALEVIHLLDLGVETEGSPFKTAEGEVEVFVETAGVDDLVSEGIEFLLVGEIIDAETDFDAF